MNVTFFYGFGKDYINITANVFSKCFCPKTCVITIPAGDGVRANLFTDPFPNILKEIKVVSEDGIETVYDANQPVSIELDRSHAITTTQKNFVLKQQTPNAKICIYTGIFGNYDLFNQHVAQSVPCDFFYFCDCVPSASHMTKGEVSETKSIPDQLTPVLCSAWIRTYPFRIAELDSYAVCIYLDGNQKITDTHFLRDIIAPKMTSSASWDLMISRHPDRKCAYDEAAISMPMPKYANTNIKAQTEYYRKEGFPPQNGLFWNGLLIYNRNTTQLAQLRAFQDLYWFEFSRHAVDSKLGFHPQGQICLPFCLWKIPIVVVPLLPIYSGTKYLAVHGHLK
jgi:hypothetical protein